MIAQLTDRLRKFRDARGWKKFHTPKDLAISVSVEAGELLEIFQWRDAKEPIGEELREIISEEIADVLLYLLALCDELEIDPLQAANKKIDVNETRFPVGSSFGIAKPKDLRSL